MPRDDSNQSAQTDWVQAASEMVQEYIVDLLGILLPGMVFTLVSGLLLAISGECLLDAFRMGGTQISPVGASLKNQVSVPFFFLLASFGFVVGGIFFRQDPKVPDRRSLKRVLMGFTWQDLKRSAVHLREDIEPQHNLKQKVGRKWAAEISKSDGAQFPYSHIKEYFMERGLDRLAEKITWADVSDDLASNRSKLFINALKIRLDLVAPEKCGLIVKIEAHIRMMSSVWFAASSLLWVCCFSLVPALIGTLRLAAISASGCGQPFSWGLKSIAIAAWSSEYFNGLPANAPMFFHDLLIYLVVWASAIFSALWLRRHVEKCFHYQRVREIFYVMETAYYIEKLDPDSKVKIFPHPPRKPRSGSSD
jgi:hypothetical protein